MSSPVVSRINEKKIIMVHLINITNTCLNMWNIHGFMLMIYILLHFTLPKYIIKITYLHNNILNNIL